MTRKVVSYGNSLTIESQYLGHYLTVYNRYTGNEVGCIGNISSNSIMLLTPWMMEVGSTFYFRILLPAPIAEKQKLILMLSANGVIPMSIQEDMIQAIQLLIMTKVTAS